MNNNNQKSDAVLREERRNKVLKRTVEGATMRTIAAELGISLGTVSKDLKDRLKFIAENDPSTKEYRRIQSERISALIDSWMAKADAGDEKALEAVLRLFQRQAKLLGLDSPRQVEHSGRGGGPIETKVTPPDLSDLSTEELQALRPVLEKMAAGAEQEGASEDGND